MVIVNITLATICFLGQCYPALIGKDTPVGEFQLVQRLTDQRGYGGDVLQFKETEDAWYAIHRVWTLRPQEQRERRLKSANIQDRKITAGCVNVDPAVYEKLRDCCSTSTVQIVK